MSLLLHVCCGPCAVAVVGALRERNRRFSAYFYNPNVHPWTEYKRRLDTMRLLAYEEGLDLEVDAGYRPEEYLSALTGYGSDRCLACYRVRLEKTAKRARERGLAAFSTTLLYSRYQRHEELAALGFAVGEEVGIPFEYEDFRVFWKEGIRESKRRGMYRQQYCGCLFSERDRFLPPESAGG